MRDRPIQAQTRELFSQLIRPLTIVARQHGYALAVHGSIARDIDLIAVPWTEDAGSPRVLADAIRDETRRVTGEIIAMGYSMVHPAEHTEAGSPGEKPHGRLGWVFSIRNGVFIDLSVMPRAKTST